ncbi:MAG: hypothetical protein ABW199_07240 [Caulobacterales bacterium]
MSKRNLIMGMIYRYSVPKIAVFFESLKATGYSGDIVMVVAQIPDDMKAYLIARGVKLIHKPQMALWKSSMQSQRYLFYRDYLKNRVADYDYVMLSDVRDVCFQANPFEGLTSRKIQYFIESEGVTIGEEEHNAWWCRKLMKPEDQAIMTSSPIICSGVIIGGAKEVVRYLDIFRQEFRKLTPRRRMRIGGGDQTIHQCIAHVRKNVDGEIIRNHERVATMGTASRESYVFNGDKLVMSGSGHMPPVLHQYDRHPDISDTLERTYS